MNAPTLTAPQMLVLDSAGLPAELAELLIAVFEQASQCSSDPDEVARIATEATIRLLDEAKRAGGDC
jgi:hypothetical protein